MPVATGWSKVNAKVPEIEIPETSQTAKLRDHKGSEV